jgi:hypothetical protein
MFLVGFVFTVYIDLASLAPKKFSKYSEAFLSFSILPPCYNALLGKSNIFKYIL